MCTVGGETQEINLLECQTIALPLNCASRARVDIRFSRVSHVVVFVKGSFSGKTNIHCVRRPCFLDLLSHAWIHQFSPPLDCYTQYLVRTGLACVCLLCGLMLCQVLNWFMLALGMSGFFLPLGLLTY